MEPVRRRNIETELQRDNDADGIETGQRSGRQGMCAFVWSRTTSSGEHPVKTGGENGLSALENSGEMRGKAVNDSWVNAGVNTRWISVFSFSFSG